MPATTNDIDTTTGTGPADAQSAIDASAHACLIVGGNRVYIAETPTQVVGALEPTTPPTPSFLTITLVAIVPQGLMPQRVRVYTPPVKRVISTDRIDFAIGPNDLEWPIQQT